METIGFNGTVITTLFNLARRDGAPPVVESAREVVERYKFLRPPKLEELFSDKIVFQNGMFTDAAIDALEVYPDGLIVRGRCDSDILDAFTDDVIGWFTDRTQSRRIETQTVAKVYESNLTIIGSDKMLSTLAPLESVRRAISASLEAATRSTVEFHSFGISFAADDTVIPGLRPVAFRLERKAGSEFGRNFFISIAPLRTKDHIKVLGLLDR